MTENIQIKKLRHKVNRQHTRVWHKSTHHSLINRLLSKSENSGQYMYYYFERNQESTPLHYKCLGSRNTPTTLRELKWNDQGELIYYMDYGGNEWKREWGVPICYSCGIDFDLFFENNEWNVISMFMINYNSKATTPNIAGVR